jgi:hypothetical protein
MTDPRAEFVWRMGGWKSVKPALSPKMCTYLKFEVVFSKLIGPINEFIHKMIIK